MQRRDPCKSPQVTQLQSNRRGFVLCWPMRIITLRVIWLLSLGALTSLEVAIIGKAVFYCEATVGGWKYDGTLMETVGRRLYV